MIKIKVESNKISLLGHANYDEYGKDIICASVSSIVMCSVEAIASFDEHAVDILEETDNLTIVINKHDDITNKLINNMLSFLKELEKKYPKNIKITNKEE